MNRSFNALLRGIYVATASLLLTFSAHAQTYPNKDISFIVPFNPGGSADPLSRAFAAELAKALPGNVNIINRAGGSATIGTNAIVRSAADGYTIGLGDSAALAYQPLVNKDLAYKSTQDYTTIINLAFVPAMLVVRADAPWKTFEDFIAYAKKNPDRIRIGVSGVRSIADLAAQQLNRAANIKLDTIPFTGGGGEALVALLGGRIEGAMGYGPNTAAQVRAGKLRVLAVFTKGQYVLAPEATSIFDAGYDATLPASYSIIAPKGLPKDVHAKLVDASLKAVKSKEFIDFANRSGFVIDTKDSAGTSQYLSDLAKMFSELIAWMDKK
jgi:tripartite-type tricarboxylate transporter receptor subunit TctC